MVSLNPNDSAQQENNYINGLCLSGLSLLCIILNASDKLYSTQVPASGARRALATKYASSAALPNMMFGGNVGDNSLLNPETPSKSLLGTDTSSSMLFSPPSILKVNIGIFEQP